MPREGRRSERCARVRDRPWSTTQAPLADQPRADAASAHSEVVRCTGLDARSSGWLRTMIASIGGRRRGTVQGKLSPSPSLPRRSSTYSAHCHITPLQRSRHP